MVQDVTASTDASFVRTTDGASVYHGAVTHDSDQPSTGLQTDRPDITHDSLQIDHADSQRDQPDLTHMKLGDADFRYRTLVPRRMDRRSLSGIPGGLRIVGDSDVELFLSNTDPGWCSV